MGTSIRTPLGPEKCVHSVDMYICMTCGAVFYLQGLLYERKVQVLNTVENKELINSIFKAVHYCGFCMTNYSRFKLTRRNVQGSQSSWWGMGPPVDA
jgi:hypothetical protein